MIKTESEKPALPASEGPLCLAGGALPCDPVGQDIEASEHVPPRSVTQQSTRDKVTVTEAVTPPTSRLSRFEIECLGLGIAAILVAALLMAAFGGACGRQRS